MNSSDVPADLDRAKAQAKARRALLRTYTMEEIYAERTRRRHYNYALGVFEQAKKDLAACQVAYDESKARLDYEQCRLNADDEEPVSHE